VEIADCMQTLFRGNSLASKIMAYCFKIYGHGYLRELLNSLVTDMFIAAEKLGLSYEVDPARCVCMSDFLCLSVCLSVCHKRAAGLSYKGDPAWCVCMSVCLSVCHKRETGLSSEVDPARCVRMSVCLSVTIEKRASRM